MVWFSTPKSLENNEVSFLALIEIVLAIGIYWGIAVYFHIYWHLVMSVFIVPFLLLQSKQSIELSLKKFNFYNHSLSNKIVFWGMSIILPFLSFFNIIY